MIRILPFEVSRKHEWDFVVSQSGQAALQHQRDFLDYHGSRFVDQSVLIESDQRIIGVFPAADDPRTPNLVTSHPGAAYGGLVAIPGVSPQALPTIVSELVEYYSARGFEMLSVRPTWPWLQSIPDGTFSHELLRLGARATPWQLISVIDLRSAVRLSRRRLRGVSKAKKAGLMIRTGIEHLAAYWEVLEERLAGTHGVRPTHSLSEIGELISRFPKNWSLCTAWVGSRVVGGSLAIREKAYVHAQYIAASDQGRRLGATDLVLSEVIRLGQTGGAHWMSLGSNVSPQDQSINFGLLEFKSEFGAANHQVSELRLAIGEQGSRFTAAAARASSLNELEC